MARARAPRFLRGQSGRASSLQREHEAGGRAARFMRRSSISCETCRPRRFVEGRLRRDQRSIGLLLRPRRDRRRCIPQGAAAGRFAARRALRHGGDQHHGSNGERSSPVERVRGFSASSSTHPPPPHPRTCRRSHGLPAKRLTTRERLAVHQEERSARVAIARSIRSASASRISTPSASGEPKIAIRQTDAMGRPDPKRRRAGRSIRRRAFYKGAEFRGLFRDARRDRFASPTTSRAVSVRLWSSMHSAGRADSATNRCWRR